MASTMIPLSLEGNPDRMNDSYKVGICMSVPLLAFTGMTVTFAALFAKTWRVNRLFHAQAGHARIQVTKKDVLAPFVVLLTSNIMVLTGWTITDPLTYVRQYEDATDYWNREYASYGSCCGKNAGAFLAPLAVINLSVVVIASWQAFEARTIKSEFAEAKYISLAMFSLFQAFFTGIPVVLVVRDSPQAYYLVVSLMIFLLSMAILFLIFMPKMFMHRAYAKLTDAEQRRKIGVSVRMSSKPPRRLVVDDYNEDRNINSQVQLQPPEVRKEARRASFKSAFPKLSFDHTSDSYFDECETTEEKNKLIGWEKVERLASAADFDEKVIEAIRVGFVDYEQGYFNAAPAQTPGVPPLSPFTKANVKARAPKSTVMSGYFEDFPCFVVKIATTGASLSHSHIGSLQLHSQATGELECVLLDKGRLTHMAAGAVSALAASYLGPKIPVTKVGVLGNGPQAVCQLRFLRRVFGCLDVLVWGCAETAEIQSFVADMEQQGCPVQSTMEPGDLLRQCEVVVTASNSPECPVLQHSGEDISALKTSLIIFTGTDISGKMELDADLVNSVSMLVSDCREMSLERGEFQHWHQRGGDKDRVVTLGQVVTTQDLHRSNKNDDSLIIFDSSGSVLQDVVIAQMVYGASCVSRSLDRKYQKPTGASVQQD